MKLSTFVTDEKLSERSLATRFEDGLHINIWRIRRGMIPIQYDKRTKKLAMLNESWTIGKLYLGRSDQLSSTKVITVSARRATSTETKQDRLKRLEVIHVKTLVIVEGMVQGHSIVGDAIGTIRERISKVNRDIVPSSVSASSRLNLIRGTDRLAGRLTG